MDPYDHHREKCGPDCFKKLIKCNRIHISWPGIECGFMGEVIEGDQVDEEDIEEDVNIQELKCTDGSKDVVKIFSQNVFNVLNGIVLIYLNSVFISVFVRIVIQIKVTLIF